MKTNYERAERIKASTQRIKLLAATSNLSRKLQLHRMRINVDQENDDENVTGRDDE